MKYMKTSVTLLVVTTVAGFSFAATDESPLLFSTADRCMACHNALVSPAGEDISIGTSWRASMMANAARDPYWQAAIRREVLEHPMAQAEIEHECGACHVPMHRFQAKAAGGHGRVFDHLPVNRAQSAESLLAVDGVSCTLCHQIEAAHLGEQSSFTAGFDVDTTTALGERQIYGPWEIDAGRSALMSSASLFTPTRGEHLQSSELCASCHTVITHSLDPDGKVVGELPEQVPYLEWKHSAHAGVRSCQSCHMPEVEGETAITGVLGQPRAQVSRHVFRGGNFFMPRLLNQHRKELGVAALPQELETTAVRAAEHLATSSARLNITSVARESSTLHAEVQIHNLAGHKLPSAYPSRRAWLHFTVHDRDQKVVFESGRFKPDGAIAGNDNDEDHSRFEPHHRVITSPDQVQIYEAILADPQGAVTTVLLTAVDYAKDNRLLPDGFDKTTADDHVAVHGNAAGDPDFAASGDLLRYAMKLDHDGAPFTVTAELLYQPIGYRWAHNLSMQQADEIERFVGYYEAQAAVSSVVLAADSVTVP